MRELEPDQIAECWDPVTRNFETVWEPFSSQFHQEALDMSGVKPGERVIDVATGPGALTLAAARRGAEVVGTDFSAGMVARLGERIAEANLTNASARVMDGQALELPDESFDVGLAMFGLIFFPDPHLGLRELYRVLKPGGRVVVGAWTDLERFDLWHLLMGAAATASPEFEAPREPPIWLCFEDPEVFEAALRGAGFGDIDIRRSKRDWTLPSPDWLSRYVDDFSPGLNFMFDQLGGEATERMKRALTESLSDRFGDGPCILSAFAQIGFARK